MITPPANTPSFYVALFEEPAARFVVGLVAESFGKTDDIREVMVTSKDFASDVLATVELQDGTSEIASHMVEIDEQCDVSTTYNPLFLPKTKSLYDTVEVDDDGDIVSIDGFHNPFTTVTIKMSIEDHPNFIDAKVVYKQFELPSLHTSLEAHMEPLLS